jgi:hypothetical protein
MGNETNVEESMCDSCVHRIIRILKVHQDDIRGLSEDEFDDEEDNYDEIDEDGFSKVVHEVCAKLHLDLYNIVIGCEAYDADEPSLINPKILDGM